MKISKFKNGEFITRIESNRSYTGKKFKLIKKDSDFIYLDDYSKDNPHEIIKLSISKFNDNKWYKFTENDETLQPYDMVDGELRLQHFYIGMEYDKLKRNRNRDEDKKFDELFCTIRIIEELLHYW